MHTRKSVNHFNLSYITNWASVSERLAAETSEEREARLQQFSHFQCERLAAEASIEREARLRQLSASQHKRLLAAETERRQVAV